MLRVFITSFYIYVQQEVETEQYYNYFLVELKEQGYEGFFSPKSRARTMSECDRKHVDGCAIFYKTEKWVPQRFHLIAFFTLQAFGFT